MGHADIKTTLKYAHLRPDALTKEMEKCFGSNSSASNDSDTKLLQEEIRRLQAELDRVNRKLAEVRPPA